MLKVFLILPFVLIIASCQSTSDANSQCVSLGGFCSRYGENTCCGIDEGENIACIDPYLSMGLLRYPRCQTCMPLQSKCSNRTDCCSNCCSGGECQEGWDTCNFTENITIALTLMAFLLVVGIVCVVKIVQAIIQYRRNKTKESYSGD